MLALSKNHRDFRVQNVNETSIESSLDQRGQRLYGVEWTKRIEKGEAMGMPVMKLWNTKFGNL